ncbi:TolC family outer membrane protein [Candidatus Igneacidithiobacillus taiwanensis]|uniref:TolC family outer membrane protein n=1 Tax=Candidatus Igneacidithiobacillus taiwanensis TaxID=1945924 RepID=UPI00289DF6A1|nr:TolC family outer membrane protein [Candidatus Igneacidithiobacillus taiwanensis]
MHIRPRAVFLAAFLVFSASAAQADDLLSAYEQAYRSDPALAEARAQLQATFQDRPAARAAFLPHLGVGASVGFNTGHFSGFAGLNLNKAYYSDSYSVTLTQSVFNGQSYVALREAGSRIQAQTAALLYSEQQLALRVATAYFQVLEAQAQERVAEKQRQLLESIYQQTEATLKVGTGDIIAVREAQARLDAAQSDLIRAQNTVAVAQRGLERLTHAPVGQLADLRSFTPEGPHPDNMGAWVQAALQDQPLIHEAQAQLRTAQEEVQYQRRARWPKLDLQGVAQHIHGTPFPGFNENQAGVSLNLSMPLYEGGSISSGVQKAQALSVAQVDHLGSVRDQVRLDTQTAFLNLQDSVSQLQAAKATVESAKVSLTGTRKGYEVGTRSIIDLLQTATDYIRAEQDYNVALYHQVLARVQLKAAAGQLDLQDLQAVNGLLQTH